MDAKVRATGETITVLNVIGTLPAGASQYRIHAGMYAPDELNFNIPEEEKSVTTAKLRATFDQAVREGYIHRLGARKILEMLNIVG